MTNREFQAALVAFRNDLQGFTSGLTTLDAELPKRLKAFTVPRLMIASQQGGPVSIVDVLKAVAQSLEDSRQMAEAWSRIDETATDTAVESVPTSIALRKMDD